MEFEHLIIYDSECYFCRWSVKKIIDSDKKREFIFAPLKGETAQEILSGPQIWLRNANSLILIEHYKSTERKFWIRSLAIFRIYWHIGGLWALPGLLSFLPGWTSDFLYKQFAAHRHQFKMVTPPEAIPEERLLP